MIEAVVRSFQELIAFIQVSFSTFALLSFPILVYLAIYILNLFEQEKQVFISLINKFKIGVSQGIDSNSAKTEIIPGEVVGSIPFTSNSRPERKSSSSKPIFFETSEYKVLSSNCNDMHNNDYFKEDIHKPYKMAFTSPKFYEVGLFLFATLGGASFLLLDTGGVLVDNIEPLNAQNIEALNDVNTKGIDKNIDLPTVDLDGTRAPESLDVCARQQILPISLSLVC